MSFPSSPPSSKPEQGALLKYLEIIDLSVDGGGIARHEGKVVFLDSGLPGSVVNAKLTKDSRRFSNASIVQTLKASPYAVKAWCEHFPQCGGCSWQDLDLNFQRKWKEDRVKETLSRLGKVGDFSLAPIFGGEDRAFRTKVTYAFGLDENNKPALGLRQRFSHSIVPIKSCALQPKASAIIEYLNQKILDPKDPDLSIWHKGQGLLRFAVLHSPSFKAEEKDQLILNLICYSLTKNQLEKLKAILDPLVEQGKLLGLLISEKKDKSSYAFGTAVYKKGLMNLYESYPAISRHKPLCFSPFSFMQSNTEISNKILELIIKEIDLKADYCILDLFCGAGFLSLGLVYSFLQSKSGLTEKTKDRAGIKILGVDSQDESIKSARINAENLGIDKAEFYSFSLDKGLAELPFKVKENLNPDIIIIDPPRAGMNIKLVKDLKKLNPKKLIYLSCDVATQARDIKELGWEIVKAFPFDMFPHTPHIENLLILEKK